MTIRVLIIILAISTMAFGQDGSEIVTLNQNENYVKVISKSSDGLTIEISVGNFNKIPTSLDDQLFYIVSLEKEGSMKEKGDPELPKIVRSISIPHNSGVKDSIIRCEFIDIDLPVTPSKGILSKVLHPEDIPYDFSATYLKDEFFPNERVEFGEPYLIRSVRGSAISIFPFAYNPVRKKLRIYTKLVIDISFKGINQKNSIDHMFSKKNKHFEQIYKTHFINYDDGIRLKSASSVSEGGRMLIIAYDSYIDVMQPFINHKNSIGLPTQIVKMSDVGSTFNDVYNYIKNNYNMDYLLTFVLLVGNKTQVPTKTINYLIETGASDPSYSLLVGNDNYPDIIIGRFSAVFEEEVTTMVSRSITYERLGQQNWFHTGIGIASNDIYMGDNNEYDYEHMRNIRTRLLDPLNSHYTNAYEFYDGSQGGQDLSGNPDASMVNSALNNGASIINYIGHGNSTSWVTSNYSNYNVNALSNDNKLPFVFSVACLNGNFTYQPNQYEPQPTICFAETWLRATNINTGNPIGAIGFYGSSINQDWDSPMFAQDLFTTMLVTNYYSSFGTLCFNASCEMMDCYGASNGQSGASMFLTWNVFGDPSINVIPHYNFCIVTPVSGPIDENITYNGCKIEVQNTTITNNANVVFDHSESTTITGPFEVRIGSTIEIL